MKANRLSTRKKDLKMNLRDAQIAEELKNNKEATLAAAAAVTEAATAAVETVIIVDGKKQRRVYTLLFFCPFIKSIFVWLS